MYIGVHVKNQLALSDFNEIEFSQQILESYYNFNIHENPFSGSRFVPCARNRRTDRREEANKRISLFRQRAKKNHNFAHEVFDFVSFCSQKKHLSSVYTVLNTCIFVARKQSSFQ